VLAVAASGFDKGGVDFGNGGVGVGVENH